LSFNERRGSFKIVKDPTDRSQELAGGIKNALEKGGSLPTIKQSFLNAGYKKEEVETAVQHISSPSQSIDQTPTPTENTKQAPKPQAPIQKPIIQAKPQFQQLSKRFILIAIIATVIVLGIAATLGIFWNRIF
jgi:hypothetical protein